MTRPGLLCRLVQTTA